MKKLFGALLFITGIFFVPLGIGLIMMLHGGLLMTKSD